MLSIWGSLGFNTPEDENWTKGLEMVFVVMVKPIGKGEDERKGKEKQSGFGKVLRRAKMTADFCGIVHPHVGLKWSFGWNWRRWWRVGVGAGYGWTSGGG